MVSIPSRSASIRRMATVTQYQGFDGPNRLTWAGSTGTPSYGIGPTIATLRAASPFQLGECTRGAAT